MIGVLTNFLPSILEGVEIVMRNFFKILTRAFFSEFSDVDLSRTVIRVIEENGVLLSKESVSGVAAVLGGELAHLRNGR